MSFAAEVADGAEMVRQLLKYDKIIVTRAEFGRLTFSLDVATVEVSAAQDVIDALEAVDSLFGNLYVARSGTIDFDYYVTADLLFPIRRAIDAAATSGVKLLSWSYRGR